jgi:hypothetical protein
MCDGLRGDHAGVEAMLHAIDVLLQCLALLLHKLPGTNIKEGESRILRKGSVETKRR